LLQIVLSGLAIGSVYGLVGMALAISFYVTRVINFAQGQLMMVAIMIVAAITAAGYSAWLGVVAGLICACVVAILSYIIAVRPILAFDRFSFGWLVSTLKHSGLYLGSNLARFSSDFAPHQFPHIVGGVDRAAATGDCRSGCSHRHV
jgi:branched-chain amino acid transport system permease protein